LAEATALYRTDDYVVVIEDAALIDGLEPDYAALSSFDVRGLPLRRRGGGSIRHAVVWATGWG
jgi:hypothetical protein